MVHGLVCSRLVNDFDPIEIGVRRSSVDSFLTQRIMLL